MSYCAILSDLARSADLNFEQLPKLRIRRAIERMRRSLRNLVGLSERLSLSALCGGKAAALGDRTLPETKGS
jgi:hypothetical protein